MWVTQSGPHNHKQEHLVQRAFSELLHLLLFSTRFWESSQIPKLLNCPNASIEITIQPKSFTFTWARTNLFVFNCSCLLPKSLICKKLSFRRVKPQKYPGIYILLCFKVDEEFNSLLFKY